MGLKFLLAGDWSSQLHEVPAAEALTRLGHDVQRFSWSEYFKVDHPTFLRYATCLSARFQNKYLYGRRVDLLNEQLLEAIRRTRPDVLFVYRGTHIRPETLAQAKINCPSLSLVGYCNDDPFSPTQRPTLWRHLLRALPLYDLMLAYREHNIDEFRKAGARDVRIMRSWYIPWLHHPLALSQRDGEEYGCDAVFIGHYENDGRLKMLESLSEDGVRLRLFGHDKGYGQFGWRAELARSKRLRHLGPIRTVWGEDYVKALCGTKIALCFLSKMNRDTYTRRCFEIPATGTLLLSERTEDLRALFREGEEADFFSSPEELRRKVALYLTNDLLRSKVAAAGKRRVAIDGHDVVSRMRDMVRWIRAIRNEKSTV